MVTGTRRNGLWTGSQSGWRGAYALEGLLSATRQQHGFHRVEDDIRIEGPGHILDVVEVVLELGDGVFEGVAVFVVDLSPTGNPGTNGMALPVKRNSFGERLDEFGPFRPGPNDRHLAFQDVEKLR